MWDLLDGDIVKYAVGFACQHTEYLTADKRYLIKQVKGKGMEAIVVGTKERTPFPDLRTKKAVAEELQVIDEELVVDPIENALHSIKMMVNGILKTTGAKKYTVYLSKGECFRHKMFPDYKISRLKTPKPVLAQEIEDYLIKMYKAEVCTEIEADDAMGIIQCYALHADKEETCICTLDKDLDTIPGWHYNWTSKKLYWITPEEAMRNFWQQVLTGDGVDDIPGLPGIGKKTAQKLLDPFEVQDLKKEVIRIYEEQYLEKELGDVDQSYTDMQRNCELLWILRKPLKETYV